MNLLINFNSLSMKSMLTATTLFGALVSQAQEVTNLDPSLSSADPYEVTRWILVGLAGVLLIIVLVIVHSVMIAAKHKIYTQTKSATNMVTKSSFLCAFALFVTEANAQTQATGAVTANSIPLDIYLLVVVVLLELLILLFLIKSLFQFLGISKLKETVPVVNKPSWFQRLNQTVAIEDEVQLDLNHNYDGIRELDNKTPGWWTYAFYFTILFGVIYLYRMFVTESLPSQLTELKAENERAAVSQARFLRLSANNVDETNVEMLGLEGINKGSTTFKANCAVCHGEKGEGNIVGPNLTDDYWIHKGGIKDIFYSIKYGVPEKGMKSWAADFSPGQIAELASFVKSLHGTNPPNAKEKQGELFVDTGGNSIDSIPTGK